jgi:hypothetical protein
VGDWGVWRTSWDFEVEGPIAAVTAKQVRLVRWGKERRKDTAGLLFSGTEKQCRDLYSILTASRSKRDAERRTAEENHARRIAKAVASASARNDGASPQTPTTMKSGEE